ncbi:lipoprotein [Spiroplasma phoeniceum]|uniref:Spiroplasma plectrovirus-related protein n=1 Tax=Spiroplasma phoeniceum P40 TaxID=1276259 RepID=A0A345DNE5_9MOLU|nr:lipoprotein [Spiroplasma phoeniceum]AXF95733.1 spiroplasma plectrovirus-related protein [Spiroplasma phoeniceum P40]
MKKWLSIIGAIGLTATSTTTLISCKKENNNENGGGDNKPEPQYNPQQPPEGSNWKLINYKDVDINNNNEKYYFGIRVYGSVNNWIPYGPIKGKEIKQISNFYGCKAIYRWDGDSQPETPTIDKNTGEITDWKEQKGTE